jgi:hypothetical protein
MNNKDLKSKLSDLYDEFSFWCTRNSKKPCQKTDFVSKLKEIQLYHKKSNGYLVYNYKLDVLKEIAAQQHWMTELDEYENETEILTIPTVNESEFIEQHNKYQEEKLRNEELQAENKNIYARLLKSNEQITNLVNMVMRTINIDTINAEFKEFKTSETKYKQNDVIKTKNNKKSIQQFVETIELF